MNERSYLDHAAATPPAPEVLAAMEPYLGEHWANPGSLYGRAQEARRGLEAARAEVADFLGARPGEIVFTSGGTEGANAAIFGVLRSFSRAHWVTSAIEHDAVLSCREPLRREGHEDSVVGVPPSGIIRPEDVYAAIRDDTVLVSLMLANNEIGTLQPVAEVAARIAVIRQERSEKGNELPLYLYTDATQAPNYLPLSVSRLGADLLSLSGSKIYGPRGTGALYIRGGTRWAPLLWGGGQESGRRSGTENVAGAAGLAAALRLAGSRRKDEARRVGELRDAAWRIVQDELPDARLNGDSRHRLPNNLNLTLPGVDGETLIAYLDTAGIEASTGSACASRDEDPSHVLLALGRSREEARSSLRLTFGRLNGPADADRLAAELPRVVRRIRSLSA